MLTQYNPVAMTINRAPTRSENSDLGPNSDQMAKKVRKSRFCPPFCYILVVFIYVLNGQNKVRFFSFCYDWII